MGYRTLAAALERWWWAVPTLHVWRPEMVRRAHPMYLTRKMRYGPRGGGWRAGPTLRDWPPGVVRIAHPIYLSCRGETPGPPEFFVRRLETCATWWERRLKPTDTLIVFSTPLSLSVALLVQAGFLIIWWYSWMVLTSSLPRFWARMESRVARAAAMVVV
jgi:hypothetical protein